MTLSNMVLFYIDTLEKEWLVNLVAKENPALKLTIASWILRLAEGQTSRAELVYSCTAEK